MDNLLAREVVVVAMTMPCLMETIVLYSAPQAIANWVFSAIITNREEVSIKPNDSHGTFDESFSKTWMNSNNCKQD